MTYRPPDLPFPDRTFTKGDGPRVLIECCDPCLAWAVADVLRDAGYEVATCWALGAGGPPRCPLLDGRGCPLVAEADLIVRSFAGREAQHAPIVDAVARSAPDTPVYKQSPNGRTFVLDDAPSTRR